jgi:hypothetical protein
MKRIVFALLLGAFPLPALAACLGEDGGNFGDLMARCSAIISSSSSVSSADICIRHRIDNTTTGPRDTYVVSGSFQSEGNFHKVFASGSQEPAIWHWNTPWSEMNNGVLTVQDKSTLLTEEKVTAIYDENRSSLNFQYSESDGNPASFEANCRR